MSNTVDPILATLSDQALRFVEDQLSGNDVDDAEELHRLFVSNGLSEAQATQALRYRGHYFRQVYLEGHTPIRKNKHAIRFDPTRGQFELIRC